MRKGFLEPGEYEALFGALAEDLRPLLAFAYYAGCRRGEILALRWEQVDLASGVVRLEPGETKNGEGRTIPLAASLRELLAMHLSVRERYWPHAEAVFFHYESGKRIKNFRKGWDAACRRAGLWDDATKRPTKLFHDLRRSAVRDMVRSGTPERVAMTVSGHKTRSIFDHYKIVSETDLHQAADRLGTYRSARTEAKCPSKVHHLPQTASVQ